MAPQQDYLARLGLDEDADERQVRRAYARELKRIDQERDLEGFQHLRACYEAALEWAAHRVALAATVQATEDALVAADADDASPAPVDAPHADAQSADGEEHVHPGVLGDAAFADFATRLAALPAPPEKTTPEEPSDFAPWTALLRETLDDPRLLHLYARVVFEHRVAARLAGGWGPGHHLLLPAAVDVFGWDHDRSALPRLGHAGAVLDEALEQRALFQSQDVLARTRQRELLSLLRQGRPPTEDSVRAYAEPIVTMLDYLPTLLGIVAPHDLAVAWRGRVTDDMLRPVAVLEQDGRTRPWWKGGASPRMAAGIAIFFLIRLVTLFDIFKDHSPPAEAASAYETTMPDSWRQSRPIYEAAPAASQRIEEARQSIDLLGGQEAASNDGSRHPKPIGASQHLTEERMADIRRRIDYRPAKSIHPGEQRVQFEVALNEYGAIRRMKTVAQHGDPAYAEAVEQAIRAAVPFPRDTPRTFVVDFRVNVTQ
jgi:protein TonB